MNKSIQKLILEFIPFIVFLLTYKNADLLYAAGVMSVVTMVCLTISYVIDKKISSMLLISGILLITTGSISIFTGDPKYFKMKPTIVYLIFASILWFGLRVKKFFVKEGFGMAFDMDDNNWAIITKRFIVFLVFLALLNEIIWRNFDESFWVNFKVFGAVPISLLFMIMQMPFLRRNSKKSQQ